LDDAISRAVSYRLNQLSTHCHFAINNLLDSDVVNGFGQVIVMCGGSEIVVNCDVNNVSTTYHFFFWPATMETVRMEAI
jgi:hypothetical protein